MTRYKVVPEPADEELLFATRDALPLVPGSVEDCCARVCNRTEVPSRDDAREWITFLQALGLAVETDRGFHRVRETPDRESLADTYRENVFGAREVLDALADRPLDADECFEHVREVVPRWERDRHADWESEWQARVEGLLEWCVVFGLAERQGEGYVAA